jgi:glutamyl/glutaminyl-tRNA synthetase
LRNWEFQLRIVGLSFRFDDTNPDAEEEDYIDSLKRDMAWLGWTMMKKNYLLVLIFPDICTSA